MAALSRGISKLLGKLDAMVAAACRARCGGWMLSAGRELYCGSTITKFFASASAAAGGATVAVGAFAAARIGWTAGTTAGTTAGLGTLAVRASRAHDGRSLRTTRLPARTS